MGLGHIRGETLPCPCFIPVQVIPASFNLIVNFVSIFETVLVSFARREMKTCPTSERGNEKDFWAKCFIQLSLSVLKPVGFYRSYSRSLVNWAESNNNIVMGLSAWFRIEQSIPAFLQIRVSRRQMVLGSVIQGFSMKGSLSCCVLRHTPFLLFPKGHG